MEKINQSMGIDDERAKEILTFVVCESVWSDSSPNEGTNEKEVVIAILNQYSDRKEAGYALYMIGKATGEHLAKKSTESIIQIGFDIRRDFEVSSKEELTVRVRKYVERLFKAELSQGKRTFSINPISNIQNNGKD